MKNNIEIKRYSEWCFVVAGDTREYRDELKNMGGRWLSRDLEWIFDNDKYDDICEWLDKSKVKESYLDKSKVKESYLDKSKVKESYLDKSKVKENYLDKIFDTFVSYLLDNIKDKDINKLFESFISSVNKNIIDDTDMYFCSDKIFLDNVYYNFIRYYKDIKHTEFIKIDKDKFILHGLLLLIKN